jgi:hypothetical protein
VEELQELLHLARQIGDVETKRFALRNRRLGREHDEERSLRQDKGGPGFSPLVDEMLPASVGEAPVPQRLSELHQPVAIPAVQPVAPGLTRRVKAHQAFARMMRTTIPASQAGGIVHLFFLCTCGQRVIVMRLITLITRMMLITLMVLVPSGNMHHGKISLSLILRSLRASGVPSPCNHLLLSLHATRCDRAAVYRTIDLRRISVITVISVINFNLPVSGSLTLAPGLAVLLFIVSIIAHRQS